MARGQIGWILTGLIILTGCSRATVMSETPDAIFTAREKQVTFAPHGHILTNTGVWSPEGKWIVYDVRSDREGSVFDGDRIERVNVETGEVQVLYRSKNGEKCGVATCHPKLDRVVFILGPENPTPDFNYAANRRQGVMVDAKRPGEAINLDARDLAPPFTPGALRGGTHVHVFSPDGGLVSFTYNDLICSRFDSETAQQEIDLRNVGLSVVGRAVGVPKTNPRNHDGSAFSVLVTKTAANPVPGSDEIKKAYEDAWVGIDGYVKSDGTRQKRAIAFIGDVVTVKGRTIPEVFIADLPDDLTIAGDGPLQGTETTRPRPPRGVVQRRLTCTANRQHPGLAGPRHWLRSSPDGSRIALLMKDDAGIVQLWTVSPNGGEPKQLTHNPRPIASAFSWSPDGRFIAHVMDGSVCVTEVETGRTLRVERDKEIRGQGDKVTEEKSETRDAGSEKQNAPDVIPRGAAQSAIGNRQSAMSPPRPEACVFSPDGKKIAFVRTVSTAAGSWNQIFITDFDWKEKQ